MHTYLKQAHFKLSFDYSKHWHLSKELPVQKYSERKQVLVKCWVKNIYKSPGDYSMYVFFTIQFYLGQEREA